VDVQAPPPPPKICVVSISPQSRASLAAKHGLSALAAHQRLISYFKSLGAFQKRVVFFHVSIFRSRLS
jgi:hypothetical protein